MNLQDHKLYTSTEVADILGVSLRSVYRYLEEGKLEAEVKTATGRHRFTKQNILDFLYPSDSNKSKSEIFADNSPTNSRTETRQARPAPTRPAAPVVEEGVSDEEGTDDMQDDDEMVESEDSVEEEKVDWLEKFRAAAERHRAQMSQAQQEIPTPVTETKPEPKPTVSAPVEEEPEIIAEEIFEIQATQTFEETPFAAEEEEDAAPQVYYYKSGITSLVELAQTINKTARRSDVDYAFTMNAGLSLYKRVRPFSTLHIYVRPGDREFFERALDLTEVPETSAQLCMFLGDAKLFNSRKEVHGLFVVSDLQLKSDLMENGEEDLASEFEDMLNN